MKPPSVIQQRRAPAKRLHHGIAGSPLAKIISFPEPQPPEPMSEPVPVPKKRGRPRKHTDDAQKQKAYRERENSKAAIETALKPHWAPKGPEASRKVSTDDHLMLPSCEKWFIPGAPHGKGLMITGGYDPKKVGEVCAAADRDEKGRRVHPQGYGANADSRDEMTRLEKKDLRETDWNFAYKIHFPKKNALTEYEKSEILEDLIRENTEGEPEMSDGWDENSVVRIKPSTLRCLLCNEPILARTSVFSAAEPHFLSRHKRFVQKAWKACARKLAPKPCSGGHAAMAQRLHDAGATGDHYCKKCKKLIFGAEFRNDPPMYVKPRKINELTKKIEQNPIGGKAHTFPSDIVSPPEVPSEDQNTQDISNKEVA